MTNSKKSNDLVSSDNDDIENSSNSNLNQTSDVDSEVDYQVDEDYNDCDLESEFNEIDAKIDNLLKAMDKLDDNTNNLMERARMLLSEFRSQN